MYNPYMNTKGWKLETFCSKWRKEFEFGPGVVESLTSFMKGITSFDGITITFQSCICFSPRGLFCWFCRFFCLLGLIFNLFYFKGQTESQKSEVILFSGSHVWN